MVLTLGKSFKYFGLGFGRDLVRQLNVKVCPLMASSVQRNQAPLIHRLKAWLLVEKKFSRGLILWTMLSFLAIGSIIQFVFGDFVFYVGTFSTLVFIVYEYYKDPKPTKGAIQK